VTLADDATQLEHELALAAIKGLTLVNGGAVVALLALVAQIWKAGDPHLQSVLVNLTPALAAFVTGLWLAILASGAGYFAQLLFRRENASGRFWRWVAIVCGVVSCFLCFPLGSYYALRAFRF
jgi:hypothetical protein